MGVPDGVTAWTVVPLDFAIQKTKQALRDRDFLSDGSMRQVGEDRPASAPLAEPYDESAAAAAAAAAGYGASSVGSPQMLGAAGAPPSMASYFAAAQGGLPSSRTQGSAGVGEYLRSVRAGREQQPLPASMVDERRMAAAAAAAAAGGRLQPPYTQPPSFSQLWQQPLGSPGTQQYMYPGSLLLAQQQPVPPPTIPTAPAPGNISSFLSGPPLYAPPLPSPFAVAASPNTGNLGSAMDISNQRLQREPPGGLAMARRLSGLSARRGSGREGGLFPGADAMSAAARASTSSHKAALSSGDSVGEVALKVAHELALGARNRDRNQDYIEVSLIEVYMLAAMCSHGLPTWMSNNGSVLKTKPEEGKEEEKEEGEVVEEEKEGAEPGHGKLTWRGFAHVLTKVAKEWSQRERLMKATPTGMSEEAARYARVTRAALVEANVLLELNEPSEISQRAIMLLESIRDFARGGGGGTALAGKAPATKKANYELWLEEELCRWAGTLEVAGDGGRPVPYCSWTFLSEPGQESHRVSELLCPMGMLDRESCQDIFSQVSCLTRLRSVVEKCSTGRGARHPLKSKVAKALSDYEKTNKVWRHKPSWWGVANVNIEASAYDVLLVNKMMREGFHGILVAEFSDKSLKLKGPLKTAKPPSPSSEKSDSSTVTLQRLGLSKAGVQERIDQLTELLHVQQVSNDTMTVVGERRKRMLTDLTGLTVAGSGLTEAPGPAAAAEEQGALPAPVKRRRTSLPTK